MTIAGNQSTADRSALERLIGQIKLEYRETASYTGCRQLSPAVERALRQVPRHAFVPSNERRYAYGNYPLPIGLGQTISQPYIVALMTDLLELTANSRVLEIGTGCGYQTAVLAEVAAEVYSIEIIPELGDMAGERLAQLGYINTHVRIADGYQGWPDAGPFDAIIVTACAEELPAPLLTQLAPQGHMVIPLQLSYLHQELMLITRGENGEAERRKILPVRFVPFTRAQ